MIRSPLLVKSLLLLLCHSQEVVHNRLVTVDYICEWQEMREEGRREEVFLVV